MPSTVWTVRRFMHCSKVSCFSGGRPRLRTLATSISHCSSVTAGKSPARLSCVGVASSAAGAPDSVLLIRLLLLKGQGALCGRAHRGLAANRSSADAGHGTRAPVRGPDSRTCGFTGGSHRLARQTLAGTAGTDPRGPTPTVMRIAGHRSLRSVDPPRGTFRSSWRCCDWQVFGLMGIRDRSRFLHHRFPGRAAQCPLWRCSHIPLRDSSGVAPEFPLATAHRGWTEPALPMYTNRLRAAPLGGHPMNPAGEPRCPSEACARASGRDPQRPAPDAASAAR